MPVNSLLPLSYYQDAIRRGQALLERWERERALGLGPQPVRRGQPLKHVADGQGRASTQTPPVKVQSRPLERLLALRRQPGPPPRRAYHVRLPLPARASYTSPSATLRAKPGAPPTRPWASPGAA
jgi:hypothetical protein